MWNSKSRLVHSPGVENKDDGKKEAAIADGWTCDDTGISLFQRRKDEENPRLLAPPLTGSRADLQMNCGTTYVSSGSSLCGHCATSSAAVAMQPFGCAVSEFGCSP